MSNEANLDGVTVIGMDIGKDVFHLVGSEERLQRCRGHRRGCTAPQSALRAREDPGPVGPAGAASCSLPPGVATHGNDQPDPTTQSAHERSETSKPAKYSIIISLFTEYL